MSALAIEQVRTIRLYGEAGRLFGRTHRAVVNSHAAAIRYLCSMVDGFEVWLKQQADGGTGFWCFIGKRNITDKQLEFPVGNEDIRIMPVLRGAKQAGLFQVVLGAILIVASFYYPPLAATAFGTTTYAQIAFSVGASMLLSGVAQMTAPRQEGLSTSDRPENGASYDFNGPVNTLAQGGAVPLFYGEGFIGSGVINAGIYAEDQT